MDRFYRLSWFAWRALFRVYFRWRVLGVDRVPPAGGAIFAANHASLLDPFVVGAAAPRQITYLARETLFRFAPLGWLLRQWHAVPLDRDRGSAAGLRRVLERLRQGEAIVLFPEGTRAPDGQLQSARAGIGLIVAHSAAPVVPVRLCGTFAALGRHQRLPRPRRITVQFGEPLAFGALRAEVATCPRARLKEIYREIADRVMAAIARLDCGGTADGRAPSRP